MTSRNLERFVRKLEMKTSARFSTEKPFCEHRRPVVWFPDGTVENETDSPCLSCDSPRLEISIVYRGCPAIRLRLVREARFMVAESQLTFPTLDQAERLKLICEEFDVTLEELAIQKV